jgi:DNA-binding transcriptional LysR family regulator
MVRKLPALEQIQAFLAVTEEASFRAAAERLDLDQSALSRRIKELEERLGYKLLVRTSHTVRPTEAGRAFYDANRRLLANLAEAVDAAGRIARGDTGLLRIGYMTFAAVRALPSAVARYRRQFPHVTLELSYLPTRQQTLALARGEIDVALLLGPLEQSDFETLELAREPLVALVAEAAPLARRATVTLAEVAASALVLGNDEQWDHYRGIVEGILARAGLAPQIALEAPSLFGILGLVCAGLGATLVPAVMAGFCPPGIVARPIEGAAPEIVTLAAWRRPADSKVRDFAAALRETRRAEP